jgi:hypothetical protein
MNFIQKKKFFPVEYTGLTTPICPICGEIMSSKDYWFNKEMDSWNPVRIRVVFWCPNDEQHGCIMKYCNVKQIELQEITEDEYKESRGHWKHEKRWKNLIETGENNV